MGDLISKIQKHKDWHFNNHGKEFMKYNPRWTGEFGSFVFGRKDNIVFHLHHFGTLILEIDIKNQKPNILPSIRGSVSDIRGVNQCLKAFNLHYKYSSTKGLQKLSD